MAAFEQFKYAFSDWSAMANNVSRMGDLANVGEVIVAEDEGRLIGGVAYVGPYKSKAAYFDPSWPIMRMLVVTPSARGQGTGRQLAEACMQRAIRDGAPIIALHTTPIMNVALPMYLRMGFVEAKDAPDIYGVPYRVYTKTLA